MNEKAEGFVEAGELVWEMVHKVTDSLYLVAEIDNEWPDKKRQENIDRLNYAIQALFTFHSKFIDAYDDKLRELRADDDE